ncbi:MAG: transposase, partial [bacterium]
EGIIEGIARGKSEGIIEGIARGKSEGIIEGLAKGKTQGRTELYKELLAAGLLTIQQLKEIGKLSDEEIKSLQ